MAAVRVAVHGCCRFAIPSPITTRELGTILSSENAKHSFSFESTLLHPHPTKQPQIYIKTRRQVQRRCARAVSSLLRQQDPMQLPGSLITQNEGASWGQCWPRTTKRGFQISKLLPSLHYVKGRACEVPVLPLPPRGGTSAESRRNSAGVDSGLSAGAVVQGPGKQYACAQTMPLNGKSSLWHANSLSSWVAVLGCAS